MAIPNSDNVHIYTRISKIFSVQTGHKFNDFEQSLQNALRLKNTLITKLQLENSDLQKKVKDLESKFKHFKTINDEKIHLLELDRETLIESFTNKFGKRNKEDFEEITSNEKNMKEKLERLNFKVKKWKSKLSALTKRKRELSDLNKEKDKIINAKDKNCNDLKQIVLRCEANVSEKKVEIETLKGKIEECKLVFEKLSSLNDIKK